MKAFVDWLAGDGQVRPMEIPSAGLVFDGSGSEGRLEFHWERRGGGCTVTAGSEGLQVDSQRIMPGTTRKLEHLEELEWAGRLARFRMEPARPRFKGKEVDDIPLADLPGGSVLVIGRGQQQDQVADTTEWRVDLDPQDSAISRRHVEIRYDSSTRRFAVSDVSSFGAMLNSRAFDTKPLVYGDRIQIRDYYFEFSGNSLRWVDGKVGGSIRARDLEVVVDLKGQKKTILQDVTVAIKSGEFVGILGGSGQGKSTFMNALCGVNPASAGEVEIDGVKLTDRKQVGELSIGFVPQEDLVHRELSVLDAIRFSARLRLRIPAAELEALVEGVIERLGLAEHRLKRVSNLSGGQRKRVSIATELLAKPSILFLDEPSSGLDPESERKLMEDLQALSLTGLTIIATTHVLATAKLLDRFCFIHAGRMVFIGRGPEIQAFISRLKQLRDSRNNQPGSTIPSSQISSGSAISADGSSTEAGARRTEFEKIYEILGGLSDDDAAALRKEFRESPLGLQQLPKFPPPPPVVARNRAVTGPGFLASLLLLIHRQWKILAADRMNLIFVLAQAMIIGFLVGWVSDDSGFRMFLGMIATMWFGCSNAAQQIVSELPIFRRERVSGLGLNSYILGKFAFLSTVTGIQSLLLFAVLTLAAGFFHPVNLPYDAFAKDLRDGLEKEVQDLSAPKFQQLQPLKDNESGGVLVIPEDFEPPEEGVEKQPVLPAWQERTLWLAAKYFILEMNILDSRARQISFAGGVYSSPGLPVWNVAMITIGLRLLALLGAAVVGVGLGLAVSSMAQSATQAVLWVPLILIPQILLGGFVVTMAEMKPEVRAFSSAMPSAAAQRVLDVANLYGQRIPKMTNLTRIPSFLSNERGDRGKDRTEWVSSANGQTRTSSFDKISPYNTAWQNLVIDHNHVGEHDQELSMSDHRGPVSEESKPRTTDRRGDVRFDRHTLYSNLQPAAGACLVQLLWVLGCYVAVTTLLIRKQYGK